MNEVQLAVQNLTKRYGRTTAVHELSFTALPGRVTGFLGPNGAGKTTTIRALLGLLRPTSGQATIGGRTYAELDNPISTIGAVLDAVTAHPASTGRDHLRIICRAAGLPEGGVDRLLEQVGLTQAAHRRSSGYSLGMRQRLAIAAALVGRPQAFVLDEPANGLDPGGIRWLRGLIRELAEQGCTVLVSSHVLAEVEQFADDVVIITGGRLAAAAPLENLVSAHGGLEQAYLTLTEGLAT
jgi:ABC-2 type transport system ATP-binding protein